MPRRKKTRKTAARRALKMNLVLAAKKTTVITLEENGMDMELMDSNQLEEDRMDVETMDSNQTSNTKILEDMEKFIELEQFHEQENAATDLNEGSLQENNHTVLTPPQSSIQNFNKIETSIGQHQPGRTVFENEQQDNTSFPKSTQNIMENETQGVISSERPSKAPTFRLEGRRIIDVGYFFAELKNIASHGPINCGLQSVEIIGERRIGLHSLFTLKCQMCNETFNINNDSPTEININHCAVAGTIATGCGRSQLQEMSAALNLPVMSKESYAKYSDIIAKHWEKTSAESMNIAAEKERQLAIAEGRVSKNGIPIIDVIADGCWSKRTYKKNYSALSGAAAIIGRKTGEVLYLGVKNKYCSVCAQAEKKGQAPKEHKCFKNYNGSSTAMESDILVEGFRCSIQMHNLIYGRMVSDGDSSTYSKLLKSRPYPDISIEKIECRNHLLRNLCNKLAALQIDTKYLLKHRKVITYNRIMILRRTIRKILKAYKSDTETERRSNIDPLYNDILSAHLHTFDDHSKCKSFFCNIDANKTKKVTIEKTFYTSTVWDRICSVMKRLASHATSLIHDIDSNTVERFNSIIAKLVGGKRINFSKRGSYQTRCHAAVVSFNTHKVISSLYKSIAGRSPRGSVNKLETKRINHMMKARRIMRKKNRKLFSKGEDFNYGESCEKPDMTDDIFEKQKRTFLENLEKTKEEKKMIQRETILQSSCSEWVELRRNLLTASNFGKVVKRRKDISCQNLVRDILYKESLAHVKSIKHGKDNEDKALRQLELQENIEIQPCGLFIDENLNYLGATPDGIIDDDTIVEIKCPVTAFQKDFYQVVKSKKLPIYKYNANNNLILNKTHIWYFQIQGQLHVANKQKCLFAIWCGENRKLHTEWIQRNDAVWKEMEPKLVSFYMDCILPELVDPRIPRNMKIRDPVYIEEAIKEKEKKKMHLKRKHSDIVVPREENIKPQYNDQREVQNSDHHVLYETTQNKKQKTEEDPSDECRYRNIHVLRERNYNNDLQRELKFTDF